MGSSGSIVGSWVRASQSLPPYGIRTPPWQDVVARSAYGLRSPVATRHEGVSIFLCVARQHSKKPCTQQSRRTSATLCSKIVQRPPPPLAYIYPPENPLCYF